MAFKPLVKSNTFKFEKAGDQLVAHYLGVKHGEYNGEPTVAHMFQTQDGTIKRAYGRDLDYQLQGVPMGPLLQITLESAVEMKGKNGRKFIKKTFDIQVDEDITLEINSDTPKSVEKKLA